MRILHTEWSSGWGGQERRIYSEVLGMRERGHSLYLATRPHTQIGERLRKEGIPIFEYGFRNSADMVSAILLARMLKREAIDVVNTHSGKDTWVGSIAAKLAGIRVLVRTRHLYIPLRRNWKHFVHFLPDKVVACGSAVERRLVEECGFPAEQVVNIPTGIDFRDFVAQRDRSSVRNAIGLAMSDYVILMVGIVRSVKGYDIALQAFELLLRKHQNAQLVVAGDGPGTDSMQQLSEDLGVAPSVHWLGYRDDVPDLMQAADCLMLSSRSEGVPQAVSQALGVGLPVVCSNVGSVSEIVQHERSGLLVPPAQPAALAKAVDRLICSPNLAQELSRVGQAFAWEYLSLDRMLDKTEKLLQEVSSSKT